MAEATVSFRITGMTCGGCAKALEKAVRRIKPDCGDLVIDHAAGIVTVGAVDLAEVLAQAADAAGFTFEGPLAA